MKLMTRLIVFLLFVALSGCGSVRTQTHEVSGTTAERIAGVSRVIQSHADLPSKIADARLIELQIGDGQLGPSDFRSFVWIKVSPDDIAKWKSVLQAAPAHSPIYDSPATKPTWWIPQAQFIKQLKLDPHPIFNRHGWLTIDEDGNIYALTYTQ